MRWRWPSWQWRDPSRRRDAARSWLDGDGGNQSAASGASGTSAKKRDRRGGLFGSRHGADAEERREALWRERGRTRIALLSERELELEVMSLT